MIKNIKLFFILILINFTEVLAKDNLFIVAKINDVIMTNYDIEKEAFAYHDPASICKVCWMRSIDFDKARYAKGTDEDVIVCAY